MSKPVDFDTLLNVIERNDAALRTSTAPGEPRRLDEQHARSSGEGGRIVTEFLDWQKAETDLLREAVEDAEREVVVRRVHGLKSGLGYLGAERACTLAGELETAARTPFSTATPEALEEFEEEMRRVAAYLHAEAWRTALDCQARFPS